MLAAAIQVLIVSNLLANVAEEYRKNACENFVGPGPRCYCYHYYYDSMETEKKTFMKHVLRTIVNSPTLDIGYVTLMVTGLRDLHWINNR